MTREQARIKLDFERTAFNPCFKKACDERDVETILEYCAAYIAEEVNEALQWGWEAGSRGKKAPLPPGFGKEWEGLGAERPPRSMDIIGVKDERV